MKDKKIITKFDVDGEQVELIQSFTTNKNAYLKVKGANQVTFQRPKWMDERQAKKFLDEHLPRLINESIKVKSNKPYSIEDQWILAYGQKYSIKFSSGRGYKIFPTYIEMKGSNPERALTNFIANESDNILKLAHELSEYYELKANFTMKNMKTQWGVCYPRTRQINLSTRLLHHTTDAIKYVIIHELAHLLVPNHSEKFWQVVEKMFPNYREIKKELKRW